MVTARIIEYWNDYRKKEKMERFNDLDGLADWIFSQMKVDYSSVGNRFSLSFPRCLQQIKSMRLLCGRSMAGQRCGSSRLKTTMGAFCFQTARLRQGESTVQVMSGNGWQSVRNGGRIRFLTLLWMNQRLMCYPKRKKR